MQAITLEQYGGPEAAQLRDVPIPAPGSGEVLVKVAYAGINFMDVHTRQGKYANSHTYPVRIPCTLGMEGAGRVVSVGEGVTRISPGARVAWCISWGAYAEYAIVPEARLATVPDALPLDMAAASLFQGATAHYLIDDVAQLKAGESCLIHAASGAIGQILIQMAKARGVRIFATASSVDKRAVAKNLGADHVLDYDDGRFAEAIRAATGGAGVDVVFDSLGRATLRDSMRATRTRGLVINYGNVSGSVKDLDPYELGEAGSLFLTRPRLADHMSDAATVQRRADAVFGALLDKTLVIPIVARYTLETVGEAHHSIETRAQIGKAVVEIGRADC